MAKNTKKGGPPPQVRKVGPGVGVLELPVHVSEGPARLPSREAEYIHRARPVAPPLTKGQLWAIDAFRNRKDLRHIAQSTGLPQGTLVTTLKDYGLSESTHKKELEALDKWYTNRRNP